MFWHGLTGGGWREVLPCKITPTISYFPPNFGSDAAASSAVGAKESEPMTVENDAASSVDVIPIAAPPQTYIITLFRDFIHLLHLFNGTRPCSCQGPGMNCSSCVNVETQALMDVSEYYQRVSRQAYTEVNVFNSAALDILES